MKPYRKQFAVGFLCIIGTNAFAVLAPLILKYGIEDLEARVTAAKLYQYSLLIVAVAVGAGIFRYLMRRIIISTSRRIEYDLRVHYFDHLQKLSSSFYDRQQTGDLMTRATSDIEAVRMVFGPAVMYSVDTALTSIFALTIMFLLSVPLTLTVLALAPILSTLIYFLARSIHKYSLRTQERYSELNAMIQEHLSGIRVVRAYCQEEPEGRLFDRLNTGYLRANMKLVKIQAMLFPLFYSIFGVGMALILYIGGRSIMSGAMSLGDFVAYSAYVSMLAWPVMAIGWVLNLIQRGSASMQRIAGIMDTEPDIIDPPEDADSAPLEGTIRFDKVSFFYPENETAILKEIDLEIPSGTSLGVIGRVGSGKSTLLSLIPRLYDISSGTLTIGGREVNRIPFEVLRRAIAVVPQDSFLFSDRLSKNILFSDPDQDAEVLERNAALSRINHDAAQFSDGLDTWVGERGITLSGGQKQRTSLARALATDAEILLFDDCFSAVDTNTEAEILRQLTPILKDKTTLIVAHRISTVQWADQIIVLHDGEIAEKGTHEELIARKGRYEDLYRKQLLEEEIR
jgi:ATP-binding cassette subfamily B protein